MVILGPLRVTSPYSMGARLGLAQHGAGLAKPPVNCDFVQTPD
jgi:putative effector of murein hydrolase